MRYAVTIAALALAVTASACATGATQAEFTRADAEAIRKTSADLARAFNAGQVDRILELYAESSVFMPPNAPLLRGRDPLESFYEGLISKASHLELVPEEVIGHGPIAYEAGTYSIVYNGSAGRDRGKYLRILRNTNGTWRAEKTIWSSDLPATTAPAD